jgi:hypothetical protein
MNSSIPFPNIEFSYETITDRKIHSNYNICFAIPQAKKYIIWYTSYQNENVCYLFELNRDKKISKICKSKTCKTSNNSLLYLGTILYGSIISENDQFIIEDILSYHGISLRQMCFGEKLGIIKVFLENKVSDSPVTFYLPKFWNSHITDDLTKDIPYQIHHVQFRSLTTIVPYLNVFLTNGDVPWKNNENNDCVKIIETRILPQRRENMIHNRNKHQYKQIFTVIADSQNDIYHLFASENNSSVYYDVAYIPNCKSSIYMNSLFRNIKENINLDFIEESDDEEDVKEDKYVDLDKMLGMECVYHTKFKRWVPIKVVDNYMQNQIVNIHDLPKI